MIENTKNMKLDKNLKYVFGIVQLFKFEHEINDLKRWVRAKDSSFLRTNADNFAEMLL